MSSSPLRPGASLEEELDYYKKQYEQLETDLADFQASSKDLEEQLERDIESAEKSERKLKEQVEKLHFEVNEWKTKHKQAKVEANNAQNALQKEVTELRDGKRKVEMRLRDIEVVNDDYERQARHTESSLEDLESKYNVAIERSVMMEEEVKLGEQERESLRIETQRLRDELGDLKVEHEISLEKLRLSDETIDRLRSSKPSPLAVESLRARSPGSEASGVTPSSPTTSTPPAKSDSMSDAPTPPSPPLSDTPLHAKRHSKTPTQSQRTSLMPDSGATPRPSLYGPRVAPRHNRGPSMASTSVSATSDVRAMRPPATKSRPVARPSAGDSLPRSDSLYQIKALRGRMQKIEARVHSARSKLPPPGSRTPTGSPRAGSALGSHHIPSSVTMRRSSKRPSASAASSLVNGENADGQVTSQRRESHVKRLSYGIPRPTSSAAVERPPSAIERPPSQAATSRPSSRASMASSTNYNRPPSRHGAGTPSFSSSVGPGRARSSFGGSSYAAMHSSTPRTLHRPSASISELRRNASGAAEDFIPTSRRDTLERGTALPTLSGLPRRQSGGVQQVPASPDKTLRRTPTGLDGEMRPPPSRRKMSDVGETY